MRYAKVAFEDVTVGDELPRLVKGPIEQIQLTRYAGASGDFNPIHQDEAFARAAGMGGVFAHGMLSMGFVAQAITDWGGRGHGPEARCPLRGARAAHGRRDLQGPRALQVVEGRRRSGRARGVGRESARREGRQRPGDGRPRLARIIAGRSAPIAGLLGRAEQLSREHTRAVRRGPRDEAAVGVEPHGDAVLPGSVRCTRPPLASTS